MVQGAELLIKAGAGLDSLSDGEKNDLYRVVGAVAAGQAEAFFEKAAQGKLTQTEMAYWIRITAERSSDNLHEAKNYPGKNKGVVDRGVVVKEKNGHGGESVLDLRLSKQIDQEEEIYWLNTVLKADNGDPKYDGLVPWALSHAALRQYVAESSGCSARAGCSNPRFSLRGPRRVPARIKSRSS